MPGEKGRTVYLTKGVIIVECYNHDEASKFYQEVNTLEQGGLAATEHLRTHPGCQKVDIMCSASVGVV